jgi:hypothetical protein
MASPTLESVVLTDEERQVLEGCARRPKTAQALALRSRIIPACADGTSVSEVAAARHPLRGREREKVSQMAHACARRGHCRPHRSGQGIRPARPRGNPHHQLRHERRRPPPPRATPPPGPATPTPRRPQFPRSGPAMRTPGSASAAVLTARRPGTFRHLPVPRHSEPTQMVNRCHQQNRGSWRPSPTRRASWRCPSRTSMLPCAGTPGALAWWRLSGDQIQCRP